MEDYKLRSFSKIPFVVMLLIIILIITLAIFNMYKPTTSYNEIISSNLSPNGKMNAILFVRDLGATTRKSYQLAILKNGENLGNKKGNAYITYSKFSIEWIDDSTIQINNEQNNDIFKQESLINGINIKYSNYGDAHEDACR